jgi:hypothetical protein
MRFLPSALAAVALLAAACGSTTEEPGGVASPTAPRGELRLGGAAFRQGTGIADAVRIAWARQLVIDEVVAVQRGGGETLTSGFVPDPSKSPEEAEEAFMADPGEAPLEDLPEEQGRGTEEAVRSKPEVERMMVCGTAGAIRSLEDDERVAEVMVAPKEWASECPGANVDSGP